MKVAEVMQTHVRAVRPDTVLAEVVQELTDAHITAVPVVDRYGRMLGVVSTSDLLEAQAEGLAGPRGWEATRVEEVMTRPVLTINPGAELRDAALRMVYAEVHRLFVEEDGVLVGVVSQTDLVRALAGLRAPHEAGPVPGRVT